MQIIFVRENSKAFTLRISRRAIWTTASLFIVLLVAFFSFGAWSIFQFIPEFAKLNVISQTKQNKELFTDVGVLKGRIEALEKVIQEMERKPAKEQPLQKQQKDKLDVSNFNTRDVINKMLVKVDSIDAQIGILRLSSLQNNLMSKLYPSLNPIDGKITSSFGPRVHPISGNYHSHTGTDYAASIGTPVKSIASGVVVATYLSPYGLGKSVDIDHGGKYISRYAHLDGIVVKEGDMVSAGTQIARVGSTGNSTGPHLHLEIVVSGSRVDPVAFLNKFRRSNEKKA